MNLKSVKMKTSLIILIIAFSAMLGKAQTNGKSFQLPATLIMPDGSKVPSESLDSIKQVFGGRDVSFSITDSGVYVHPQKNKIEQVESDKNLNSHLDKAAPGFDLLDINGSRCSLAGLKGKIVVLNFWFTQCGGCVTEMPDLNALKKRYSGKDVVFLAITFNDNTTIKAFLATKQFDYTIVPNAAKLCKDYNIYEYPTSMVIDRTGAVKFIDSSIEGGVNNRLTKAIDPLLFN
jgi:peroxiredoxin